MADDKDQRTEKATPKKKDEERKKGNVGKSRELVSASVLLAALGALYFGGSYLLEEMMFMFRKSFMEAGAFEFSVASLHNFLIYSIKALGLMVLPVGACVFAIALFSNIAQVGFLYTTEPLAPKLEKIDPIKGLQKIISLNSVVELIKSISKIAIVASVVYLTMKGEVEKVAPLILMSPVEIVSYISSVSFNILMKSSWVLLLLAALDYSYQKWDYEKKLRMTKQEIKDESKQSDGDPQQKARVRSLQREWAMSRMMDEVLKADVVITNPTHFAIALKYNREQMGAPRVVAKGRNHLAQRIKELAIGAGVPIVEDKPLARAIFKSIDVGGEIPANLYKAVAEILVHIYKLKGEK